MNKMISLRWAPLFLLSWACASAGFDWHECLGEKTEVGKVVDVSLSPEPVPAGSTATFTIRGATTVGISEGKVTLKVYYLGLPVYKKTLDLQSPIPIGVFSTSIERDFPSYTPPGQYKVRIQISDDDGKEFLCLDVKFKVSWGGFSRTEVLLI